MDFYFDGHLRWDWGFGNPNKTATLLACLLVLSQLIRLLIPNRRVGLGVFSVVFLALGVSLIHTYSRGGIVAAVCGLAAWYGVATRGRFSLPPLLEGITSIVLAVFLAVYASLPAVNATGRYTLGMLPGDAPDRSITNRIAVWKDAPRMMTDAPGGWGRGNSGEAWTQWYQKPSTRYRYRTLVNSHLTWLAEWSWPGRFLYIAGWLAILSAGIAGKGRSPGESQVVAVATGVWVCFGAAATFSSVAESPALWIAPILCVLAMAYCLIRTPQNWIRMLILPQVVALLCVAALWSTGKIIPTETPIRRSSSATVVGSGPPEKFLLQPDKRILGGHYGFQIREHPNPGWVIAETWKDLESWPSVEQVVLSGVFPDPPSEAEFSGAIVVLNPLKNVKKTSGLSPSKKVMVGSLRKDEPARSLRSLAQSDQSAITIEFLSGRKLYLGNWVELVRRLEK